DRAGRDRRGGSGPPRPAPTISESFPRRSATVMMDIPLNVWMLFDHAPQHFADTEVVTLVERGKPHRYTYGEFAGRAQQLMHALDRLGIDDGATVATFA